MDHPGRRQCNLLGWQLSCIGVSEAVRNRHALFLTELESVTLIDPAKTELVYSESPSFVASCLFIGARLRRWSSASGVMDDLGYQVVDGCIVQVPMLLGIGCACLAFSAL